MDLQQIVNSFLKLEQEEKFCDISIQGIHIWKYMRCSVLRWTESLVVDLMPSEMPEILIRHKKGKRFNLLKQMFRNGGTNEILKYLPFFSEKRDLLCLLHPTRKNNGRYDEEVYVDKYYSQIKKYTYYALEWSPGIDVRSSNPQTQNLRYTCDDVIITWFGRTEHINYKKIFNEFYIKILRKIEERLDIHYTKEGKKCIYREIYLFYYKRNAYMRYYEFILDQISPKAILYYNLSQYYTQFLVEIGKKKNIKTIEIQHGSIGEEFLVKYFLALEKGIFPEYILTDSVLTNEIYASKKIKTICIGRPDIYQTKNCEKKKYQERQKKVLLFISSSGNLSKYLYRIREKIDYDKYEVILKLHPGEYMSWKSLYPFLVEMKNIRIVGRDNRNIYYWAKEADYMIGYWSTAFYETLYMPVVKILLDENLRLAHYLIEKNYCLGVKDNEIVVDVIEKVEKGELHINEFLKDDYIMYSNPIDRMDTVLDEIILEKQ